MGFAWQIIYTDDPNFKETGRIIRKQLIKLHVGVEVIGYNTPEFRNQTTGQRVHAAFPEGLKDEVTYDGTVKAFAYLLNNECYVGIGKTQNFIKEVTGGKLDLSAGLICNLSKQFSEQTKEERDEIFLKLFSAPVLHADFTFAVSIGKGRRQEGTKATSGNTGIPGAVQAKFEATSGLSFEDVRVHYNSSRPAQLGAYAYTQGSQVYIGPGQERHLEHELGHAVQQKRGIVKADGYINGVPVNRDPGLERAADLGANQPVQGLWKSLSGVAQMASAGLALDDCPAEHNYRTGSELLRMAGMFMLIYRKRTVRDIIRFFRPLGCRLGSLMICLRGCPGNIRVRRGLKDRDRPEGKGRMEDRYIMEEQGD